MNLGFQGVIASCCLSICVSSVQAQDYPSKPIRIVVPVAAGGANDVIARAVGRRLSEAWRQPVIIENRPDANGQIAPTQVAKAEPDGHTLLTAAERTFSVNPYLYDKLPYDPSNFVPVSGLARINQVLVVHPSLPVLDIQELIVTAKAKPRAWSYATVGPGSASHLNMELLQSTTGMKLVPVHYRGGALALTDVIGGHVQMIFISAGLMAQPWKAGQVRALGVGSPKRLPEFPDLRTIAETGVPGFEAFSWFGLFAPAGTPSSTVSKVNAEVQRILSDAAFQQEFMHPNLYETIAGSPKQFADYVGSEATKWSRLIREANIKID